MKKYYCTCKTTGYREVKVDSEEICLDCGYYAMKSIPEITKEENWNKSEIYRIKRESEMGKHFLFGGK